MGPKKYVCLDVGERRVGVAFGSSDTKLAWPNGAVAVGDDFADKLKALIEAEQPTDIVVGRPRNQKGEATAQTAAVEDFVTKVLAPLNLPVHWQDESVTSVMAEERLQASKKSYTKEDIDATAAAIILQDFLEAL